MKKRKRKKWDSSLPHFPTPERMQRGDIAIRNNRGVSEDPLRIDKLLKNGIIGEMQHLSGVQIITLWTIASRPFIKSMAYEPRSGGLAPNFEHINLSRLSAQDQLYKTMAQLTARDRGLIVKICFEETPAIQAGKQLGLPINSITVYVRSAFDALGEALAQMRCWKKTVEKDSPGKDRNKVPELMEP